MQLADITRVGVVGAGTMGAGIAELFAESGYEVIWYNRSEAGLQRGLAQIRGNQQILIRHQLLTPSAAEAALTRLAPTTDLQALASVELLSESVAEALTIKQELFRMLDRLCPPDTLLTTDTSGLPISALATALAHPARFAGMHFANPPHLIPIMEIIKGDRTADATCALLVALAQRLHKHPVVVQKDVPGFVGNRLQMALLREALYLIEAGIASPAAIDTMIKHGLGLRWAFLGPLEIMDLAGLDVVHTICSYLFADLSDTKSGSPLLQTMVAAGKLGAKSGTGFYDYPADTVQRLMAERDANLLRLLQLKSHAEP